MTAIKPASKMLMLFLSTSKLPKITPGNLPRRFVNLSERGK